MKVVVVSPHRGDAALSLGLSVDAWLAGGKTVEVLNVFTVGTHAPYSDVGSLHPHDQQSFVVALRRREDLAWNRTLGGKVRFHDLDLLDAPVRLHVEVGSVREEEIRAGDRALQRVVGSLSKLARMASSGGIAIAVPLGAGGHLDHRIVRAAALETIGSQAVPLGFYLDWMMPEPTGVEINALLAATGLELEESSAAPPLDGDALEEAARRKRRMAVSYDSQLDSEAVEATGRQILAHGGRERLWVNRAWRQAFL